jgi:hypothetical protein
VLKSHPRHHFPRSRRASTFARGPAVRLSLYVPQQTPHRPGVPNPPVVNNADWTRYSRAVVTDEQDARTWRRWFTLSVGQFVVAGYLLMAYGIGRIVRATSVLDASVQHQTANADLASQRLEHHTGRLVDWTRLLAAVTMLLLLATVVILFVTIAPLLGFTVNASTLANVGSSARLAVGDDVWNWVGRVSSIVTILGLAALYFQLRQLTRRTNVKVGFHKDPGGPGRRLMQVVGSIEVQVHWNTGDALSQPIRLAVIVVNEANASATAHDVNFEVRYPMWLVPEVASDFKEPPGMNQRSISQDGLVLNPGLTNWIRTTVRVPRGRDRIQLSAIASMRDGKMVDRVLMVVLKES